MLATLEVTERMWGPPPALSEYAHQWSRRGTLVARAEAALREFPILLTPSSAEPPFVQDRDTRGADEVEAMTAAQWPQITVPVLGLPAVSVPTGIADGLPTGVQLVGGRHSDLMLLDAADQIEARTGRFWPPAR